MPRKAITEVYCAYCGKYMYSKPYFGRPGKSHGVCDVCSKIEKGKLIDQIAESRGISKDEARKLVEKWEAENP